MSKKKLLHPEEIKRINSFQSLSPIHRYAEYKAYYDFNEGDVLVKFTERYDYTSNKKTKAPVYISQSSKIPKKYMVVHKDKVGFCWIKQISVKTGETIGEVMPIMSLNGYDMGSFEVDPEQATADLLGQDYSFKDQYDSFIKRKTEIIEANKTCLIKWKKYASSRDVYETLKSLNIVKGSKIWVGNNSKDVHLSNKFLEVVSITLNKKGFVIVFTKESVENFRTHSNVGWYPVDWRQSECHLGDSFLSRNTIYHSRPQSIDEI